MRRCVIHIGHPKTATTYLQHCLHLNAALFADHGYWVPTDFTALHTHDLAALSEQGAVICGNLGPLHELMCDGPGTRVPAMHDFLFDAPGLPANSDVVLSSELFFYYVGATVQVVREAQRRGLQPELIAFLQRQDQAAVTAYLQNVRYHGFSQGVVDFLLHDRNMAYCNYLRIFENLRQNLPDVPITLRTADRRLADDGDLLATFLRAASIDVDPAACRRPVHTSNPGLRLEQYELLRVASILGWDEAAARLRNSEVALNTDERARLHAYYYREGLYDFLTAHYLPDNAAMLDRFMPQADAAERAFWTTLDAPAAPVTLNAALMQELGDAAFNG